MIIPDIHNKTEPVDEILACERYDEVVFLGDYFDEFYDTVAHARRTAEWLKAHLHNPQFTFLFGNHDMPYRFIHSGVDCPGFDVDKWQAVLRVLTEEDWGRFRLHAWVDGWLLSHAGWSAQFAHSGKGSCPEWVDELCAECLQTLREERMHPLVRKGRSRGGYAPCGGITWQDWRELTPVEGLRQIVGHTAALDVRRKGGEAGSAVCLDTGLRHVGFLENGQFSVESTYVQAMEINPR